MRLPRRALVLGAVAIVIALVALAVWAFAAGGADRGVSTRQQVITVTDGPGKDQQVHLDSTLYVPDGVDAQHPAPAVIGSHGWGANKVALHDDALDLARAGYVVLLYSARGFGDSSGQVALDSPDYEVLDVKQLITWLAGQPGVLLDGPDDPRVGLAGPSYGGGITLLTAAYDRRVDAIVPSITWNSLVTSLLPNTAAPGVPGVYKQQWAGIFSIGVGGGCARLLPTVCQAFQNMGTDGTADPQTMALLTRSSPASVISQIHAPTLLMQGAGDTLFPVSEAVASYRGILATGTPVRMVWLAGGHDTGFTDADQTRQKDMTRAWFDHWLKRDSGVVLPPAFTYARPDVGGVGTADEYPPPGGAASYALSGAGQLVGPKQPVTATAQPMLNPPGGRPASVSSLPGIPGLVEVGQFIGNFAFDVPGEFVAFQSAPLGGDLNVVGTPNVAVRIVATADPVTLFAKLYDAAPDGKLTLPQQQIAPLRLAGTSGAGTVIQIPLAGISHLFPAGHSLRLVFATTDMAYFADRQPATLFVSPVQGATLGLPTQPVPDTSQLPIVLIVVAVVLVAAGAALLIVRTVRRRRGLAQQMAVEPPGAPPVDIVGLSKRFKGGVLAVDDVSFRVAPGQIVGLLGPNGAGKTTTLRMLLGLVNPTGGQVRLFGHRVRPGHPVLHRVGAFVEGPGIPPYLTGLESLREYWRYGGDPDSAAHFDHALRIAGLGDAGAPASPDVFTRDAPAAGPRAGDVGQARAARTRRADQRPGSAPNPRDARSDPGCRGRRDDRAAVQSPARRGRGSLHARRRHGPRAARGAGPGRRPGGQHAHSASAGGRSGERASHADRPARHRRRSGRRGGPGRRARFPGPSRARTCPRGRRDRRGGGVGTTPAGGGVPGSGCGPGWAACVGAASRRAAPVGAAPRRAAPVGAAPRGPAAQRAPDRPMGRVP